MFQALVKAIPRLGIFAAYCSKPRTEGMQNPETITYLTQREAAEIDETLMGPLGFSVDQLMVRFIFFFSDQFRIRFFVVVVVVVKQSDLAFADFFSFFCFRNWLV